MGISQYVREFLDMKCAGDVLNACNPVNNFGKEITESMAIVKKLKAIVLLKPNYYTVYDFCAGNALTSVLIAHLLPVVSVVAVDSVVRERVGFSKVRHFNYIQKDILKEELVFQQNTIIIGVHACGELSSRIVDIYKTKEDIKHIVLLPCCREQDLIDKNTTNIEKTRLSKYEQWCVYLARLIGGNATRDKKCTSPCNIVVTHSKEEE